MTSVHPDKREAATALALEVQTLQAKAHAAGLHVSAKALNNAMNALGWEAGGEIELAGRFARGDRPYDQPVSAKGARS